VCSPRLTSGPALRPATAIVQREERSLDMGAYRCRGMVLERRCSRVATAFVRRGAGPGGLGSTLDMCGDWGWPFTFAADAGDDYACCGELATEVGDGAGEVH
jgi:hypothetical protein